MKLEVKDIPRKLLPLLRFFKTYAVFGFVLVILCLFGFLVFRINQFNRQEPDEDAVTEKLQTVQRPRIDQDALDKIQQLEDQNIQVKSLFRSARDNPFNE
jgi:hypothetical protein